jgi:hypothetical protein
MEHAKQTNSGGDDWPSGSESFADAANRQAMLTGIQNALKAATPSVQQIKALGVTLDYFRSSETILVAQRRMAVRLGDPNFFALIDQLTAAASTAAAIIEAVLQDCATRTAMPRKGVMTGGSGRHRGKG